MSKSIKIKILNGLYWSFGGRIAYMAIGLITNIILARFLGPEVFGIMGILIFFLVVSKVLVESGLSGALVRKKTPTEEDYSTIFIFNLILALIIYIIIYMSAELISEFYNDESLIYLLRVVAFVIIIDAFRIVQDVKLVKNLDFKTKSKLEFIAICISSVAGIVFALYGFGVWSLVITQISSSLILSVLLWITQGGLKKYVFSTLSFMSLYKFGVNTTASNILNTAFDNIYNLVFAKYFSITQTGLFFQARKLQEIPTGLIQSTLMGVAFSALSQLQENETKFNKLYISMNETLSVVMGFISLIIFFYAEEIITMLYGDAWFEAAFFLKVLILTSFFHIQEMFNRIVFKIFDRTERIFQLELFKKAIQLVTIFIGIKYSSIEFLLYGFLLSSIISFYVNNYFAGKIYLEFSLKSNIKLLKLLFVILILILSANLLKDVLDLKNYYTFILFPFLILAFISLISILKIYDIKSNWGMLKS